jgi:hypothetical protein
VLIPAHAGSTIIEPESGTLGKTPKHTVPKQKERSMKPIKKESAAYREGYVDGLKAANARIRNVIFDDRLRGNELVGVYYALDREFFTAEAVISDTSDALQKATESREYYALLRAVLASADTKLIKAEITLPQ